MVVVIGGHSRSVGKTSAVAGIIAALREWNWTAVKVTQYGHGICSNHGGPCACAVEDQAHTFAINDEQDRSGGSDTSRFLLAGAKRSIWVRTRQGFLAEAMPDLRRTVDGAENIIFESNSVLRFIRPDLYLSVLDYAIADFKRSAHEYLDRADAIIVHAPPAWSLDIEPKWNGVSLKLVEGKKAFRIHPPQYVSPEIVSFIQERRRSSTGEL